MISLVVISAKSELSLFKDGFDLLLILHALVDDLFFVLDFNLLIRTLLIDFYDVGLSKLHKFITHILGVPLFRGPLDLMTNLRIFRKQIVQ